MSIARRCVTVGNFTESNILTFFFLLMVMVLKKIVKKRFFLAGKANLDLVLEAEVVSLDEITLLKHFKLLNHLR